MDNDKPPSKTPPKKETPPVIEEPKKTQVQTKETPLTQQEIAKKQCKRLHERPLRF